MLMSISGRNIVTCQDARLGECEQSIASMRQVTAVVHPGKDLDKSGVG